MLHARAKERDGKRERERDAAGRPERHEWNVQIRRVDIVPRRFVRRASRHALGQSRPRTFMQKRTQHQSHLVKHVRLGDVEVRPHRRRAEILGVIRTHERRAVVQKLPSVHPQSRRG